MAASLQNSVEGIRFAHGEESHGIKLDQIHATEKVKAANLFRFVLLVAG